MIPLLLAFSFGCGCAYLIAALGLHPVLGAMTRNSYNVTSVSDRPSAGDLRP